MNTLIKTCRMKICLSVACAAVLGVGGAAAAPITIQYIADTSEGDAPSNFIFDTFTEDHTRGEYKEPGTDKEGYRFVSPVRLYLDAGYKHSETLTTNTYWVADHLRYDFALTRSDGTTFNAQFGNRPVSIIEFQSPSIFTGGTVSWYWRFTRVPQHTISVVSAYSQNVVTTFAGSIPRSGPFTEQVAEGFNVTFEAPEYVYLDKNQQQLPEGLDRFGDSTPFEERAFYRARNIGYKINNADGKGGEFSFDENVNRDITVTWLWELEYAVYVESGGGAPISSWEGSGGEQTGAGRFWVPVDREFQCRVPSLINDDSQGLRTRIAGYVLTRVEPNGELTVDPRVDRGTELTEVGINPITISAPYRLQWEWTGQVKYTFDAMGGASGQQAFHENAFIKIGTEVTYSNTANFFKWVDVDPLNAPDPTVITVGAFYRTKDRRATLADFLSDPNGDLRAVGGDISVLTDELLADLDMEDRVARTWTVRGAQAPTQIHWYYKPTVFRAEVALGGAVAPAALVPELPSGVRLSEFGPNAGAIVSPGMTNPFGGTGSPWRWDQVDKKVYPVHPGSNQIQWPTVGNTEIFKIEIVSGFPGDTAPLSFEREEPSTPWGRRQGGALSVPQSIPPQYVWETPPLSAVDGGFPGAPRAHYRTLSISESERRPPTKLDISAADPWKFQDLTFSETTGAATEAVAAAAVNKAGAGIPYTSNAPGRSVLLYSYRPNVDEVAIGDLAKEKLAVRVVESLEKNPIGPDDDLLVLGRRGLELGHGSADGGAVGVILANPGGVQTPSVNPGTSFVLDFWLAANGLQKGTSATLDDCVTTEGSTSLTCASTAGLEVGMGLEGTHIAKGTKIAQIIDGTTLELSLPAVGTKIRGSGVLLTAARSITNCATTAGSSYATCDPLEFLSTGMAISGPNIAPGTLLDSFEWNPDGELFLNQGAIGTGSSLTLTATLTLEDCLTTQGSTEASCASTSGLFPGAILSGAFFPDGTTVLSVDPDGRHFTLSQAATGTVVPPPPLSLAATNKPITVVETGGRGLRVTLDAEASTITAYFRGIEVTHDMPKGGAAWRHCVVHVFPFQFFGYEITVVDFYIDGQRVENAMWTSMLEGSPALTVSDVAATLGSNALRFGVDVDPANVLQIDQFRIFNLTALPANYLSAGELRLLRTARNMMAPNPGLRGQQPLVWFSFEESGSRSRVWSASEGSLQNLAVGTFRGDSNTDFSGAWTRVALQEVATRIDSTLDNAGFGGSGYILNEVSNYNASLYQRDAEVGTWGPVFPVNDGLLYNQPSKRLEIAYYENPYLNDRTSHPNVAWPYEAVGYDEVTFPTYGPHKDKAIYIASRIGSEGVDRKGRVQEIFDLAKYSDLTIYNQPESGLPGYNPNEEHALTAPSGRAALKVKNLGEVLANNPPLAAFALQKEINASPPYTSDPWVLVQVNNLVTGEPQMAAYQVFKDSNEAGATLLTSPSIPFPRPPILGVNAIPGLAYESAANSKDRFLTIDPSLTYNFKYVFEYPVVAGDLLIPPYPLNVVIGNVSLSQNILGNIEDLNGGGPRVTVWKDVYDNAWVVSGGGKFFYQFFYPFRSDFFFPQLTADGTPVPWLPEGLPRGFPSPASSSSPQKVIYQSEWGEDYPKLKRGETVTYQGGEYFNENPGSEGLPALVAMAATEVVFDSKTPSMRINETNAGDYSARIMRPLDRREVPFTVAQMAQAGFTPGAPETSTVLVVAERWYFKDLSGSLSKRLYFDSLAEKLVFRGRLNDKESGNPDLTAGPDPINFLEPNFMTPTDLEQLRDLSDDPQWGVTVQNLFNQALNPTQIDVEIFGTLTPEQSTKLLTEFPKFTAFPAPPDETNTPEETDEINAERDRQIGVLTAWSDTLSKIPFDTSEAKLINLKSLGVGSALVPNPGLLTADTNEPIYVTIAENNNTALNGAPVSLHIIEIIPDRYRGAIQVIEAADAFSEKIDLQHNGEFGANTADLYYEWWIRDASQLNTELQDEIASLSDPTALSDPDWQRYTFGQSLHKITFQGRPDVVLSDKLVLMRYRHRNEPDTWNLVPFEVANAKTAWKPAYIQPAVSGVTAAAKAPFQWAGAASSPQLQASGDKHYIPQLVMGWVKRVLDRINPYEARYTDFFSNESPATYSSQIQIAGGPFAGKVALNPDKNVIENVGLIELYETVLARARELSIDNSINGNASDGVQQALLLAATRLSVLYELLAREAYSDAQDSTITVTDDSGLAGVASFTHAFQNIEADEMHEELALLRGTDFLKSYPVQNRLFWNYAKGLGEAAYNVNYNIYDANTDGFINEDDARLLYPQGHGDAWGHFLSAIGMHYTLLQHPGFTWKTRSELYSLMQNVLEVDYLDEKTFARLASAKARAGRDIVRGTYRLKYTQDPDGQWQGYTDGADPVRAWGVSEWAHRAGQGACFDWMVANALLPEQAAGSNPENLDLLERSGAEDEIGEIAGSLHEIQIAMDEANGGVNPLGLDADAMTFDIDPYYTSGSWERKTHFDQVYERAVAAGNNAMATLDFAAKANNKLRRIADDTDALIVQALRQDIDYRNRLIEIFGRPYEGMIGFGKAYPEGYEGPDTLLFAYLDRTSIERIVPATADSNNLDPTVNIHFNIPYEQVLSAKSDTTLTGLYEDVYSDEGTEKLALAYRTNIGSGPYEQFEDTMGLDLPVRRASSYAFEAPDDWGQRTSYGKVQTALEEMLAAEIEYNRELLDYFGYIQDWEVKNQRFINELELFDVSEGLRDEIQKTRAAANAIITAASISADLTELSSQTFEGALDATIKALPDVVGFANDLTFGAAAAVTATQAVGKSTLTGTKMFLEQAIKVAELVRDELIAANERDLTRVAQVSEVEGRLEELVNLSGGDGPRRHALGVKLQELEIKRQAFVTAQAEGFRLLKEREAFNKILAASVQKNRYQDMLIRLTRNESMSKYQSAFNHAARYAWLTARAYDYETSLEPDSPSSPGALLNQIVKERRLGLWTDGQPQAGQGGLAEILSQLNANFQVLRGQLGINNPQSEVEKISLRRELFRIRTLSPILQAAVKLQAQLEALDAAGIPRPALTLDQLTLLAKLTEPENQEAITEAAASDERWKDALKARIVPNLNAMPEFVRYCRPFATGIQPGIVIQFPSFIEPGSNFFGLRLTNGDHSYSSANYATKIQGFGVWLENYNAAGLATSPRAYMVPIGDDYLRTSRSPQPLTRTFSVVEQRIPTPFTINQNHLGSPGYIPSLNGVDGAFGELRRHGDFRIYHDSGGTVDDSELIFDSRLISRSVWNSQWMLVIPGIGLDADPLDGLTTLSESITDIKIYFQTSSHQGE
jgi:hypothetical protein